MAHLPEQRTRGEIFDCILNQGAGTTIAPQAKSITIIRPIAEQAHDGTFMPTVTGMRQGRNGPEAELSNITFESVHLGTGLHEKFSGLDAPSDRPNMPENERPFSGLYIRVKGRQKANKLSPMEHQAVMMSGCLVQGANNKMPLRLPDGVGLLQCIAFQNNGQPFPQPQMNTICVLRKTAYEAIFRLAAECAQKGIDIFHPQTGHQIIIRGGTPIPGRSGEIVQSFEAELGPQLPIPPHMLPGLWRPWNTILRKLTYDELMQKAVAAYGQGLMRVGFGSEMDRLFGPAQPAAPVYGQPAYGVPPVGQPAYGMPPAGQPAYGLPPTPGQQAYQPAPAGQPAWGGQPAPAPAPAGQPAWGGQPAAPVQPPAAWGGQPAPAPIQQPPAAWGQPPAAPVQQGQPAWGQPPAAPVQPPTVQAPPAWGAPPAAAPPAPAGNAFVGTQPLVQFPPSAPAQHQQVPVTQQAPPAWGQPPAPAPVAGPAAIVPQASFAGAGQMGTDPEQLEAQFREIMAANGGQMPPATA